MRSKQESIRSKWRVGPSTPYVVLTGVTPLLLDTFFQGKACDARVLPISGYLQDANERPSHIWTFCLGSYPPESAPWHSL